MASPWSLDGDGAERTEGDGRLWRGECTPRGPGPNCGNCRFALCRASKGGFWRVSDSPHASTHALTSMRPSCSGTVHVFPVPRPSGFLAGARRPGPTER